MDLDLATIAMQFNMPKSDVRVQCELSSDESWYKNQM